MLDPRIYRMGLLPVLLAVIVLAFSLSNQRGPLGTSLAPDAYNGSGAFTRLLGLAAKYPERPPGSASDQALAGYVAGHLRGYGFAVSSDTFEGRTVSGPRTLQNVVGVRAGQQNGTIVVVAHRDGTGSPATAELSGTAVLLELARVLSGETLQHTVILASTSGSAGGAGATRLAGNLPQPVDAVIVLGDVAGTGVREPVVVPWSDGRQVAPPVLRNTVGAALGAQAGLLPGSTSLLGQLTHLAVPMVATEQGPFGAAGEPAVLLSLDGERTPALHRRVSPAQITSMGRTVLQTLTALDAGPSIPRPSTYLSFSGKMVPAWAVRLLVLTLILPVLGATIDGVARVRRRGSSLVRGIGWAGAAALPFVLAVLVVLAARAVGWISAAPEHPVGAAALHPHGGQLALLAALACLVVIGVVWLRPLAARMVAARLEPGRAPSRPDEAGAEPAAGLLALLCLIALALWLVNPFAALLLFPALHLWTWIVTPDVRLPRPAVAVMLLAGLALPVLVAVQYSALLGLGPLQTAWSWVLLLAGGSVSLFSALVWSLFWGCLVGVVVIAVRSARQAQPEPQAVTVRGPVTYAGPGSLGGTESALRR